MFNNCFKFFYLNVQNFNTINFNHSFLFNNFSKLKKFDICNFNSQNVSDFKKSPNYILIQYV